MRMKSKAIILTLLLAMTSSLSAQLRVDINMFGRSESEGLESGYTAWTFGRVPSAEGSFTYSDGSNVTIKISPVPGLAGNGVRSNYWKQGVVNYGYKLLADGAYVIELEDPTGASNDYLDVKEVYVDSENNPNRKYVEKLAAFYNQYLVRKDIATMTSTAVTGTNPVWDKKCYLMGLNTADQKANPNVAQTIGWNSLFGGFGVFDPLSKTPITAVEGEVAAPEDTPSEGVE